MDYSVLRATGRRATHGAIALFSRSARAVYSADAVPSAAQELILKRKEKEKNEACILL